MTTSALPDEDFDDLNKKYGEPPFAIGDSVLSLPKLLTLDIPERKSFLPFLSEGSLIMVYGPPGVGKTYFGLSLAAVRCQLEQLLNDLWCSFKARWIAESPYRDGFGQSSCKCQLLF